MRNSLSKIRSWRGILSVIADLIACGGLVWGIIRLLQGRVGLITAILLIIGISGLWVSSFYFYFRRNKYAKWVGRLLLTSIIVTPILTATGFFGWKYYQSRPSDKVIILVADFEGPDPQNYRVTETIVEQLRVATKKYNDVQVQTLNQPITAQEGSDVARAKGKEHKASIVLWGWYGKTKEKVLITIHFQVLIKPIGLFLLQEKETLKLSVAELENFTIQEELSSKMSYLTLLTLGLARYDAQDYNGAIEALTDALNQAAVPEQMIEPAAIYFYRGTAYAVKGNTDSAIRDYNTAIEINPNDADVYNNRGIAYTVNGALDSAIRDYNTAIEINPNDADTYYNRGVAFKKKGDLDSAIRDFNKAIELKPNYADAYNNRGNAYSDEGNFDSAIKDYSKAIEINPGHAYAYNNRGYAYAKKGDLDSAFKDYSKAIEINPHYASPYNNRGNAYFEKGDLDSAIMDFNKATDLNPDFAGAYNNRGNAYAKKGDLDSAIKDYNKAIEINPNDAGVYYNRGLAYAGKGDLDLAITDYGKAIELKPDFVMAYNNRGNAYAKKGDLHLAITDYGKAIELKPDFAMAYLNRGNAYQIKVDKNKAIADFKKVLELSNDPNMRQLAMQQLQKLGG